MLLSRRLDDREITLKQQSKAFFQISCAGHEAVQTAAGMLLRPGFDWVYPYYRDRALCLALGVKPLDMLLQAVGAGSDPFSGGRQMPTHWSSPELNIVSPSSATGTQFLQAVGCAQGCVYQQKAETSERQVALVCGGEGATSEGEFWESINAACLERLPVLFLIEDNGYAISVPVEYQTPGGNISKLLANFPGLMIEECDGLDLEASRAALEHGMRYCRSGAGPALVHAHVIRPYGHSHSDDETLYKSADERAEEAKKDPILRLGRELVKREIATDEHLAEIRAQVERDIAKALEQALDAAPPRSGSAKKFLYSPTVDPTSAEFSSAPQAAGDPRTMVDLINACLHDELRQNQRIVVFGEDIADCSHEEHLETLAGKGGVFKATRGLQKKFGSKRVFNAPIAEAAIVGRAQGMATRGMKPIVEIQFFDYIWPAMMQIRDELASLRWRSNNGFSAPLVIRAPIGGYLNGGAVYHSQSGESIFTHIPGIRVVFPSNAADANGLLRTAIRCDDPVLFLEHKRLYRETYNRSPYPGPDYMIPFGKAATVRKGEDLTIVTYGALVQKSLVAANAIAEKTGAQVEVLDLRSLNPYDWDAIAASVRKTSRVIVAHEDTMSWGFGAEIAARIADELFEDLDAPVRRVAAQDTWVAYNPQLEREILPQTEDLEQAATKLLEW
ncbi:MAG: dehydrogenase E1 component subunit alpha/beta [Bryobacterales bacterium]